MQLLQLVHYFYLNNILNNVNIEVIVASKLLQIIGNWHLTTKEFLQSQLSSLRLPWTFVTLNSNK